ncbi:MAG: DUF2911 domain-containing protein [Acidobacteria bacterium]|nr:DUF2911 domain-containing protein [Acidobacteriota bacterium]MBU1474183.1 DUF2911 domain-containing protein [Acidobacteriota bacterium]MBU4494076.1 DUF2911 domain-containing protein [Acidobacteriota bacterium]MCG2814694.1 DUF2911 domain-containing protein [Candidatus Aminicenantes bacterium]
MKRLSLISLFLILSLVLILPSNTYAQGNQVPKSLKAGVMQRLGVDTDITIEYSRPGVKGREIWGKLVPYGLAPGNRYSDDKPYPWRAGANENTTIEFSKDVLIEGKALPAGKYSIHMIPGEKEWTICFNKDNEGWGSFKYNQENDALRVTVIPVAAPHQEWLSFGFDDLAGTSATAFLCWEKIKVPFKIALTE